jgi:hypothetical protein
MDFPGKSLSFGLMGLLMALWTAWCLWRGHIPNADGEPYTRADDHFHFNAYIFGFTLIASLFIGAAVMFYVYPDLGKRPALEQLYDE